MAKILLVEDDPSLAETMREWLLFKGHDVEHAGDGEEALEMATTGNYEIIILDWQLPAKEGVEVCREYRAAGGTAPILMLTGKKGTEQRNLCMSAGATGYLAKPFRLDQLTIELNTMLGVSA